MLEPYKLFTDGSFFPYLKRSGIGGYLLDPLEKEVFCFSEVIEDEEINTVTNQPFEILALEKGLQLAQQYGIDNVVCHSDDESLCHLCNMTDTEMIAHYIEKNKHLARIFDLKTSFHSIYFQHIRREDNTKADLLSREAFKSISRKRNFKKSKYSFNVPGIYYSLPENYRDKHLIHYKRKQCKDFIIFKIEPKSAGNFLNIYSAYKNNTHDISHQLMATHLLGKNWMAEVVDFVAYTLSQSQIDFLAFYVLGHHQKVFEDIFTGFNDVTQKTSLAFEHLKSIIEQKKCVLYYQEENVLHSLFGKNHIKLEGKQLLSFLKDGLSSLSDEHYFWGSHPEIENYFDISPDRQDVTQLKNKYFGEYVRIYLKENHHNLKNTQEIKNMIACIKKDLHLEGIKI